MKEILPADESKRETGLPQPWPGPGPTEHCGQGKVRAGTSGEGQKAPAHPWAWGFQGPWCKASDEVLGEAKGKGEPCFWGQSAGMPGRGPWQSLESDRVMTNDPGAPPAPPLGTLPCPLYSSHSGFLLFLETQQAHLPPPQGLCTHCPHRRNALLRTLPRPPRPSGFRLNDASSKSLRLVTQSILQSSPLFS